VRAAVEAETQCATADAKTERPCEVQDAADVLPIPINDVLMGGAKPVHAIGLERPGRLRMSRVTQRPFGEPDERVPDGLAIGSLAIAKPAKPAATLAVALVAYDTLNRAHRQLHGRGPTMPARGKDRAPCPDRAGAR
jgi:hypothetical protein